MITLKDLEAQDFSSWDVSGVNRHLPGQTCYRCEQPLPDTHFRVYKTRHENGYAQMCEKCMDDLRVRKIVA